MALLTFLTVVVCLVTEMVSASPTAPQVHRSASPRYAPGPYSEALSNLTSHPKGVFVLGIDGVLRSFAPDHTVFDYRQLDADQVQQMAAALSKHRTGVLGEEEAAAPNLKFLAEHPGEVDGRVVQDAEALLKPTDPLNLPHEGWGKDGGDSSPMLAERERALEILQSRQPRPCGRQCDSLADCRPIGCYACFYPGGPGNIALCFLN